MIRVLHKIAAILMAFVVVFSTMSFTIDMHYCGNTLVETAIFHKAKGCGMDMEKSSTNDCSIVKDNCCNDKQIVIEGQEALKLNVDTLSLDQQQFVASFIYSYIHLFESFDKNTFSYGAYKPPLVVRQLYKLDENYLI